MNYAPAAGLTGTTQALCGALPLEFTPGDLGPAAEGRMNGMRAWRRGVAALLATLAFGLAAPALAVAEPAPFQITLKPLTGGDDDVDALAVRWQVILPAGSALDLTAPITYAGVEGVADRIEAISATDAAGPIAFTTFDDPPHPGGFPHFRHWKAERPVAGVVEVAYLARVRTPGGRGGPPFDLRASGGGLSGAGSGFLLLPRVRRQDQLWRGRHPGGRPAFAPDARLVHGRSLRPLCGRRAERRIQRQLAWPRAF